MAAAERSNERSSWGCMYALSWGCKYAEDGKAEVALCPNAAAWTPPDPAPPSSSGAAAALMPFIGLNVMHAAVAGRMRSRMAGLSRRLFAPCGSFR